MPFGLTALWMFAMGACWGSFAAVAGSRWAVDGSVRTRSHCEDCNAQVSGLDVIPIVSYPALKGRCRHCGARIPLWCWLIELATAAGMVGAVYGADGDLPLAVAGCVLVVVMAIASSADLQERIIPYRVTGAGALLALIYQLAGWGDGLLAVLPWAAGGLLVFGTFGLLGWFGLGDALLIAMIGLWLGPLLAVVLVVAILSGAAEHVADRIITGKPMKGRCKPFVPALFFGVIVALWAGWPLIDAYLTMGGA